MPLTFNERIKLILGRDFNLVILGVKLITILHLTAIYQTYVKSLAERVALVRFAPYTSISKGYILMNVFFKSQFNYCSLLWMCHSRKNNRKINKLNEACIRIIRNYKMSLFESFC